MSAARSAVASVMLGFGRGEPHEADSSGSVAGLAAPAGASRPRAHRLVAVTQPLKSASAPHRHGRVRGAVGMGARRVAGDLVAVPQLIGRVEFGERPDHEHPGFRGVLGFRDGAGPDRAACECRSRILTGAREVDILEVDTLASDFSGEPPVDARIGCRCVPAAHCPIRSSALRTPLPRALSQDRRD
jgi:hypothetical protein